MDRDAPAVCLVPDTQVEELKPFIKSLRGVPKSGVHNPLKNVERYLMFGEISRKVCISLDVYCVFQTGDCISLYFAVDLCELVLA
jgi:hypothetical protein